ncbi:MAG: efflux RND transporter periplasmic adaptor subunit [Candidatus Sumerlaeia bacterium]
MKLACFRTHRVAGQVLPAMFVALAVIVAVVGPTPGPEPARAQTAPAPKTLYTCGMHPEVISDTPGNCPKCGMKLVAMDPDRARAILEARGESSVAPAPGDAKTKRKILYWRSSMDPNDIRNAPGKDTMGMDLIPVYEDEVAGGPSIRIDPVTEQNMGLRLATVRTGPLVKSIRTVGTVQYDEQSLGAVTTKVSGWVQKVYVSETGAQVHKGDRLFDLYSPELYSAQEEYLVALRDAKQAEGQALKEAASLARSRLTSARDRLRLFDISDAQIQTLEQEQKIQKALAINAQLTGIVIKKNIVEGDELKAGMPAYQIADLSTIWVIGKVYETDMPYVQPGQEAQMRLDYLPGRTYRGRVTYVYPYLEPGTREIPVRMEFHNPGYDLKPGMYATIELRKELAAQATLVPAMAVINTGERQVAFVMSEPGRFEPRRLATGARTDNDELQVLGGLAPGERVVVSGQFLLDSESNLREAALKMLKPGPVETGRIFKTEPGAQATTPTQPAMSMPGMNMDHDEMTTTAAAIKYVCPMPSHAGILYDKAGDCPLCGMRLVPVQDWQMNRSPIVYWTCPMPEDYDVREPGAGKCPKCGMTLIPVTKKEIERFEKAPAAEAPAGLYTCPMPEHADVVGDKPGACPRCGMKLVLTGSVPHGKQAEAKWRAEHPKTK